MTPETQRLLDLIRLTCRILGLTHRELGKRLGVSSSYLSRLFTGAIELKMDHVVEIARAMDLEPGDLLEIVFPPSQAPRSEGAAQLQHIAELFGRHKAPAPAPDPEAAALSAEQVEELLARALQRVFEKSRA